MTPVCSGGYRWLPRVQSSPREVALSVFGLLVELDAPGTFRTIVVVSESPSDGNDRNSASSSSERGWARWVGLLRHGQKSPIDTDAIVAAWKNAWMEGAEARWHAKPVTANPHANDREHAAWEAGWRWADQNPDRRNHANSRLAHPHRRLNDSNKPLTRALQVGAAGVTVFWLSRTLQRWARGPRRES